ncbi:MAG: hypothetical protein QME94_17690, partial [Anaerolineae bacterium]|nr:hypothetical protein [Anaerolineae bacterium]
PSLTEEQRARILVALATRHALWADLEALPPFAGPTRPLVRGRRLSQLSSGEAQRWLLAQSQLVHADLWLLDEPLQGLDAWGALTLRAELARYAHLSAPAARRYAVVVSHDPRLDDLATSVWRLGRGRVAPA